MTRAQRLLALIQILRHHRYPITAQALAQQLDISTRTLYRDIAQLQEQGACIEGAPGVGYVLRSGFLLPPLMFSPEEVDALLLGIHWVARNSDPALRDAARQALTKINAVVPDDLGRTIDNPSLMIAPPRQAIAQRHLPELRAAIRQRCKVSLQYRDVQGHPSTRIVWPVALGYFDTVRILVAWCELRQDFRHFRTDRIDGLDIAAQQYPQHHHTLLRAWKVREGIPLKDDY